MPLFGRDRRKDDESPDDQSPTPPPAEPMVNRTLELQLLRTHLGEAGQGRGHAVLLVGDSGVGKSRLALELITHAAVREFVTISAQGLGRGAQPLLPIKDALRAYLGRTPDRVRTTLLAAAPLLLDAIPFIGAFLGKVGEALVEDMLRGTSVDGIYEELSRVLVGVSQRHGLLFVIEDLHDVDQDTLYFVNYLLRKIRDKRVLVLLTVQSEKLRAAPDLQAMLARWTADGYATLTVTPLERAHVGEYVRSALSLGTQPEEAVVERVFRLTGGNPFYLRETMQILADPSRGAAGIQADSLVLPPRLELLLRQRLAPAQGEVRELLNVISVLDGTPDIEPIRHLMDVPMGTAVRALNAACELGIITEGPAGETSFTHDILRAAVYAELGATYRRYLHQRAGEWYEQRGQAAPAAGQFERAGATADMVRTSLQAAARAEALGLYHSALFFYQKARPHMAMEQIGPLLGRALITTGDWTGAEEIIGMLPAADSGTRLLRAQLLFVRGDFTGALDEARAALDDPAADRAVALHRIADIALYLGDFDDARRYAVEALQAADSAPIPHAQQLALLGAIAYHSDDLDQAEAHYRHGLELIADLPAEQHDVLVETMLRGNLANVALARGDVATARQIHAAALKARREVADARGALHSMHALGLCHLRAGDTEAARDLFEQTDQLAESLGETLERAKLALTRGLLRVDAGDAEAGYTLIHDALRTFEHSQCRYDITHARIALSIAARAAGRHREVVTLAAAARATVTAHGYGLLRRMYPEVIFSVGDRIGGALTAYACGDALGLPYETYPPEGPSGATPQQIETVHAREGWPLGSTSDDTALTLLVSQYLLDTGGAGDAEGFLRLLGAHAPTIRGLGPSTTAAVEHYQRTGGIKDDTSGSTNGAAMRALPVGWAWGITDPDGLYARVIELSRTTHRGPDALIAACVIAECAAWSVEGAPPVLLLEIARESAGRAAAACGGGTAALADALSAVADGTWTVPAHGPSMDPAETVSAVLHCVCSTQPLRQALVTAIGLGGDADTVAAMVGGLLGAAGTRDEVLAALPYSPALRIPDADRVAALAHGLAAIRAARG